MVSGDVDTAFADEIGDRPVAIGIALAIALTSAVWWNWRPRSETPIVTRFTVSLADDELMASYPFRAIAISPDGRQIVWASNLRLNIRSMGSLTPTAIAGTDHGFAIGSPAFSPDGKSIVYATLGDRGAGAVFRTIIQQEEFRRWSARPAATAAFQA